MKHEAKCACEKINQSVRLTSRHICNCSVCKIYAGNSKTCVFYTTGDFKIKKGAIVTYKSGENSNRVFCSTCHAFIGMTYKQQKDTLYLHRSLLKDVPKGLPSYRHIF